MIGLRKFTLTVIGLASFTMLLMLHETIDPFWLGLGLGVLLSPQAIANVFEHLAKRKESMV